MIIMINWFKLINQYWLAIRIPHTNWLINRFKKTPKMSLEFKGLAISSLKYSLTILILRFYFYSKNIKLIKYYNQMLKIQIMAHKRQ